MCNNDAVPGFAHDGVILPLNDLLTQIGADTSDIIPASLAWVTYQNKLYGLPFLEDTYGFYWNTDAFTEVGLDRRNRQPRLTSSGRMRPSSPSTTRTGRSLAPGSFPTTRART